MTFTKRQFFIYRIHQCIKLLNKLEVYLKDVYVYVQYSKYSNNIDKLIRKIKDCQKKINEFNNKVNKRKV